jgi:DNA polymerase-3 subunit alpha
VFERLNFELSVILEMDYPGYFLIVSDFLRWAKENGIPVGPGRGSGAVSLVAWALSITNVDPIEHDLLFERFLNPYRVSLPDFDIDFDVEGREKVIEHVREKYGDKNVCQISTFGSLKAKAVVRGVARVLDFPYSEADKIAKLIPNDLNITLNQALDKEPKLALLAAEGSENEQRLIRFSRQLEDLNTHLGTHAAGMIIMDQDIRKVMPVCTGKEGALQSMYPMKYAEEQGAVKFDFLGLQNLSTIENTLDLITKSRPGSASIDITSIPMDDPLTVDLLCRADTIGVFQLESSGMKRLVANMQPSVFEDIVAILACV